MLGINSLLNTCNANVFSHSVACSWLLLMASCEWKLILTMFD